MKIEWTDAFETGIAEVDHDHRRLVELINELDAILSGGGDLGRVGAIMVREFQHVSEGAPLLEILDDRNLEMELIVPSRWLAWLKPGLRFTVAVDETGHSYKAEIFRLSGKVDAVSQSIKVYGRLVEPAPELLPGMSGKAQLTPP